MTPTPGTSSAQPMRRSNNFPQAIDAFEHALKLNPLHASAQFGLSRAYQQSGDASASPRAPASASSTSRKTNWARPSAWPMENRASTRAPKSRRSRRRKFQTQIPVKFVDVTREAGLHTKAVARSRQTWLDSRGPGACFLDYDNDGKSDIFLADNGASGGMSLYHNLGKRQVSRMSPRKPGSIQTLHADRLHRRRL